MPDRKRAKHQDGNDYDEEDESKHKGKAFSVISLSTPKFLRKNWAADGPRCAKPSFGRVEKLRDCNHSGPSRIWPALVSTHFPACRAVSRLPAREMLPLASHRTSTRQLR